MRQRKLRPPPTAIIVGTEWLADQPFFKPQCQSILDKLHRAEVWHQLGKRRPTVPRARLLEELSKWSWGQVPGPVIEEAAKSRLVRVPDELSDNDVALLTVFVACFTLAVSDVRAYTRTDLREFENLWREEASSLREEAAVLKKHGLEARAEDIELQASEYEADAEASELNPEFNPIFEELDFRACFVERHQAPPHVPAYCVLLAKAMRAVYGRDLRGTVATIATTALDLRVPVSAANVRYWCENKNA